MECGIRTLPIVEPLRGEVEESDGHAMRLGEKIARPSGIPSVPL